MFLVAWGTNIEPERSAAIVEMLKADEIPLMCLGENQDGSPGHPLYIPYETKPRLWRNPVIAREALGPEPPRED